MKTIRFLGKEYPRTVFFFVLQKMVFWSLVAVATILIFVYGF